MQRIGVDIGGTFTDLVVYDEETGRLATTKAPTTPSAPEEGLLQACRQLDIDFGAVSYFMHGTTLVTNMILTRTGAKVGVITTKGFRDVLEIGRSYRWDLYNLQYDRPKSFVPRYLVREVTERVDHKGKVNVALDRAEVAEVVGALQAEGVEAIAVSLFNSYANAGHEWKVAEVIKEIAPKMYVSLSAEVDPRIREYQRISTTVLNAYAMPRTRGYIERLDDAVGIDVKYMHSGGGIVPSAEARRFPVTLVASGPAAGVLACKFMGDTLGIKDLITADVGGTSFDVCVIKNGQPDVKDEVEVEWGIPARTQSIDVNSIGAGGGSIAWVDEGGALRAGPKSAGAVPGPACYDQGGTEPTVTDANLVIGLLAPENFLGGNLKVNPQRSWETLRPIADKFNLSEEETAVGIFRIVNASMAQAIQQATVKKGIDPRDFTLVSFGGAGGVHAVEVAREVGIPRLLVPIHPSTFSAFGLLTADLKDTATKTVLMPMDRFSADDLQQVFSELEEDGRRFLVGEEKLITGVQVEHILDIRYEGQSNEVAVHLTEGKPLERDAIYEAFEDNHYALFGTRLGDPGEVVNVRVTVTGTVHPLGLSSSNGAPSTGAPQPREHRKVALYDSEIAVFDRRELGPGTVISEPCIIQEDDSTVFMPEGCEATIDSYGNIMISMPARS